MIIALEFKANLLTGKKCDNIGAIIRRHVAFRLRFNIQWLKSRSQEINQQVAAAFFGFRI
jgi:hypothetical protein